MRNKKIDLIIIEDDVWKTGCSDGEIRYEADIDEKIDMLVDKLNLVISAINNLSPKNKGRE